MKKILKYLLIILVSLCILYNLIIFGLTYLYFHRPDPSGSDEIKEYEFKTTTSNLKKEFKMICDKSSHLSYKDSVYYQNENTGNANTIQITKEGEKLVYFLTLNEKLDDKNLHATFFLYYINGKSEDDFGWFSFEKHKKVKLFEKEIIEPLSKKYKKLE
ncbi:hypothetical protein [Flavobacterium pectinovorum]|uniref:Uncharacterized protein n=1 Tax=Flavobacterium pectinovorum TaxID=29533 RepID=A0AB36P0G0_9FLAO|nr:hypothetical protein [Flavobacterium pectinovorum]OXB04645.1 hypothetical protein B0A72_11740 [Flavobacterium pectinovorum]SHL25276.1 hypothetical protein SAMN05444387_0142 [Flavobacterium pectinovorum]